LNHRSFAMVRMKQYMKKAFILTIILILNGCYSYDYGEGLSETIRLQIINDVDTVKLLAVVELTEAEVAGDFPVNSRGAKIKTELVMDKRVYTRGELCLRGTVIKCLKGHSSTSQVSFNIATPYMVLDRNNEILNVPCSNIPDLTIGKKYTVMFAPDDPSKMYYTCIWTVDSPEAQFIERYLNKLNANSNSHSSSLTP